MSELIALTDDEKLEKVLAEEEAVITDDDLVPENLIRTVQIERLRLLRSREKVYIANLKLLEDISSDSIKLMKLDASKDVADSHRELAISIAATIGNGNNPFLSDNIGKKGTIPNVDVPTPDDIVDGETLIGDADLEFIANK